jgi:hypothetical protein
MPLTLGRAVALLVVCALLSVGLTLASVGGEKPKSVPKNAKATSQTLTVPDVTGRAYVFAKSTLQLAGFAWRVKGKVDGFAGNIVSRQDPAAGTVVVDNGSPLVVLRLHRPSGYRPSGEPDNASPYPGNEIQLVGGAAETTFTVQPEQGSEIRGSAASETNSTQETPISPSSPSAPTTTTTTVRTPDAKSKPVKAKRPRAFAVAGAPSEPLDEMPLPKRARMLGRWLELHREPTQANVQYWLYQHAWIVTGAKYGWWHGAEALRVLIGVDDRVRALWGLGSKSEQEVKQALAFVQARMQ